MFPRPAILVVFAAGLVLAQARAQAPAGFRTHADEDSGLTFHFPIDFQEIPLPPTESVMKARYVRKTVPDCLKEDKSQQKPQFEVFVLPRGKEGTTPRTPTKAAESRPAESRPAESRPESAPESRSESGPATRLAQKSMRERFEAENRIEGFEEFRTRRLAGWDLKPIGIPVGKVREYALVREKFVPSKTDKSWPVGFLWVRDEGSFYLGLVGFTASPNEKDAQAEFRKVARSIVLRDPGDHGDAADRIYAASKLPHIPFRIGVRKALPKGWKAADTENFIIVHHTDNEKLVNKISRDLEAIRPMYVEMFPPVKTVETVSIVRVCKDRAEYLAYGGDPRSGGFWHPGNEELVFYDYAQTELETEKKKGRRLTDRDAFVVLYHEAFHQYIHFAVGQVAPHDWFNEGHGDYFSGAIIPQYGTRVTSIGPSRWRITRAKRAIDPELPRGRSAIRPLGPDREDREGAAAGILRPADGLVLHGRVGAGVLPPRGARGQEAPEVEQDPHDLLRDAEAEDQNALAIAPGDDNPGARDLALKAAFDGVFFGELDAAVKSFIQRAKHPWPEDLDL